MTSRDARNHQQPAPRKHQRTRRHRHQHHRPETHHHSHNNHSHSQLRLKCIVLGSAGAGKTSLLRRFVHGTFERDDRPEDNAGSSSSERGSGGGRRNTTSTLGADYYVKKVDNPLFGRGRSDCDGNDDDDGHRDEMKNASPSSSDDSSDDVRAKSHVLVQLWDTAGRERLRQPRAGSAASLGRDSTVNFYQFLSMGGAYSSPSDNSSRYEHRYNNWGCGDGIAGRKRGAKTERNDIGIEQRGRILDKRRNTLQKHGRPLHYHRHNAQHYLRQASNEPVDDALFRNIDACMLVYDATSSMSFLHLMQWHSEWVRKLNRWEREEEAEGKHGKKRMKQIPFIVVANKLDLLEVEGEYSRRSSSFEGQKRRSVMGFCGGQYGGRELRYEYAAENARISCERPGDRRGPRSDERSTAKRSGGNCRRPARERLTYSLKETSWSTDASYLDALRLAEDRLRANRPMILLWCERNGIPHVEASALDGRGVDEAMERLVRIGVEELGSREKEETSEGAQDRDRARADVVGRRTATPKEEWANREGNAHSECGAPEGSGAGTSVPNGSTNAGLDRIDGAVVDAAHGAGGVDPSQYYFLYQPRQEEALDLFARYSPKEERRCSPFGCWPSLFSYCRQ